MRADASKRLTVLSEAEKTALYSLPQFDDFHRTEYFSLTSSELALVFQRKGQVEQIYCLLQIGYFKATRAFFRFSLHEIPPEDIAFIIKRYFSGDTLISQPLRENEYYTQRNQIATLFGYRFWSKSDRPIYLEKATQLARRDCSVSFMFSDLFVLLNAEKIVRTSYSTLQKIIGDAKSIERSRLAYLVDQALNSAERAILDKLIMRENLLSELAAIKQDAKHFGYTMMVIERQKRNTLEPLYQLTKTLLPKLEISQQNLNHLPRPEDVV